MRRVLCLVSGGIDSPTAAGMIARKCKVVPLHFSLYPFYCKGSFERTIEILEKMKKKFEVEETILFPWAEILSTIFKGASERYRCVLCRKSMLKAAERLCEIESIPAMATGEVLGQKASQTLHNLCVTSYGIKPPILRPLLGLDKMEIEKLSKDMGIWSEVHVGCCNAAPERPVTKAKLDLVNKIYEELKLQEIIERNLKKIIRIKKFKKPYDFLSKTLKVIG